jgi:hypothetical protein
VHFPAAFTSTTKSSTFFTEYIFALSALFTVSQKLVTTKNKQLEMKESLKEQVKEG